LGFAGDRHTRHLSSGQGQRGVVAVAPFLRRALVAQAAGEALRWDSGPLSILCSAEPQASQGVNYTLGIGTTFCFVLRQSRLSPKSLRSARTLNNAILNHKNALFYETLNSARVGDLFMSPIHTCELNGANPFDYLTELQRHSEELKRKSAGMDALELSRDVGATRHTGVHVLYRISPVSPKRILFSRAGETCGRVEKTGFLRKRKSTEFLAKHGNGRECFAAYLYRIDSMCQTGC
jgi:hypothetical protein